MKTLCFFKPILVVLFLILALESLQLLLGINYYPHRNSHAEIMALVSLVYLSLSILLALKSIISAWIVRRSEAAGFFLLALTEAVSLSLLVIVFTPAIIFVMIKSYPTSIRIFWLTGYGVYPIIIVLSVFVLRFTLKERFKSFFYNIIDLGWKPAIVALPISLVWLVVFMATHSASGVSAADSATTEAGSKKPNVILISFDALSASNMSLYGYGRPTTPFWESFAQESYLFERMHSNFHITQPSLTSMLTGKYPWTHGVFGWLQYLSVDNDENIAAVLKDDYQTAAIVPAMNQLPEFFGLKEQFEYNEWVGTGPPRFTAISNFFASLSISRYIFPLFRHYVLLTTGHSISRGDEPFESARKYIADRERAEPFFMWVHLWPPHVQNHPPPPFLGTFLDANAEVKILHGPYENDQQGDVDKMRARYDEVVLFTDDALKSFIDDLKTSTVYDESIIIVTADHGETFEGGYVIEPSPLMREAQHHIPLLIHMPGQTSGIRVKTLAEQVDLAPTILSLIGKPIPEWMEGESLVPYMKEPDRETDRTKYSMVLSVVGGEKEGRGWWFSAYWKDFKMIYHMDQDLAVLFQVRDGHQVEDDLRSSERGVFKKLRRDLNKKIDENYSVLSEN